MRGLRQLAAAALPGVVRPRGVLNSGAVIHPPAGLAGGRVHPKARGIAKRPESIAAGDRLFGVRGNGEASAHYSIHPAISGIENAIKASNGKSNFVVIPICPSFHLLR